MRFTRIRAAGRLLSAVGSLIAGVLAFAQEPYHEKPPAVVLEREPVARLWWGTPEEASGARRYLASRPDHEAMELLAYAQRIPKDEQGRGRRVMVISLLHNYGTQPHVVDFLVDNVDLYRRAEIAPEIYRWIRIADYPCAIALSETGQWFLPQVLRRLEFSEDVSDKALELYARLLVPDLPTAGDPVKEMMALVERGKVKAQHKKNLQNFDRFIAAIAKYGKPGKLTPPGTPEE